MCSVELRVTGTRLEDTIVKHTVAFIETHRGHVLDPFNCVLVKDSHLLDIWLFFQLSLTSQVLRPILASFSLNIDLIDDLVVRFLRLHEWIHDCAIYSVPSCKLSQVDR